MTDPLDFVILVSLDILLYLALVSSAVAFAFGTYRRCS
jgi:hypothetical protein